MTANKSGSSGAELASNKEFVDHRATEKNGEKLGP
jgi:hypothetical protein